MNELTAKEKAEELVKKFYDAQLYVLEHEIAVKSTIISCDEVIAYAKTFGDVTDQDVEYFESVKEELLKM